MRRFHRVFGVLVVVLLLLSGRAGGEPMGDAGQCAHPDPGMSPDLVLKYCTRAIQSGRLPEETLAVTFYNRGNLYLNRREFERAIEDFSRAIRLKPKYERALFQRANAYYDHGEYDRAIEDYSRTIRLSPDLAQAYFHRGRAYLARGENDRAVEDYTQVLRLQPNDAGAFNERGIAYARLGRYARAVEDFSRVIRLKPKEAAGYYDRGMAYRAQGDSERAIEDYTQAIRLDPNLAQAFNNRGNAYADRGDYSRAEADFDRAIQLNPRYALAFQNLGGVHFRQGRFEAAAAEFAKAVQLAPGNTFGVLWLYLAQTRAGKEGGEDLARNAARLDLSRWPGPVVSLYLGKTTAAAVREAARDAAPKLQKSRQCQASFFLGEYFLGQGRKGDAVRRLWEAAACPPTVAESGVARSELKRLGN